MDERRMGSLTITNKNLEPWSTESAKCFLAARKLLLPAVICLPESSMKPHFAVQQNPFHGFDLAQHSAQQRLFDHICKSLLSWSLFQATSPVWPETTEFWGTPPEIRTYVVALNIEKIYQNIPKYSMFGSSVIFVDRSSSFQDSQTALWRFSRLGSRPCGAKAFIIWTTPWSWLSF